MATWVEEGEQDLTIQCKDVSVEMPGGNARWMNLTNSKIKAWWLAIDAWGSKCSFWSFKIGSLVEGGENLTNKRNKITAMVK